MNQFSLHLHSEMPAFFCIDGQNVGMVENIFDDLEVIVDKSCFVLQVFFLSEKKEENFLNYSAQFRFCANKLTCKNENIIITDFGMGHFRVEVLCKEVFVYDTSTKYFTQLEGLQLSLVSNFLSISDKERNFCYYLPTLIYDVAFKKVDKLIVLRAKTCKKQEFLIILNDKLQLIFEGIADKFEFDGKKIVSLREVKDIAMHGLVETYQLGTEGFKRLEQYFVYLKDDAVAPANFRALPWAFMEAINVKNFKLARSYLHPSLSQALQDEHLGNFFGDFLEVLPCVNSEFNVLSLSYQGNPRFVKNYKFDLTENRILNIDCLD